jgi:hypothetical protein
MRQITAVFYGRFIMSWDQLHFSMFQLHPVPLADVTTWRLKVWRAQVKVSFLLFRKYNTHDNPFFFFFFFLRTLFLSIYGFLFLQYSMSLFAIFLHWNWISPLWIFVVLPIGISLSSCKSVSLELSWGDAVSSLFDIPTLTRRRITSTPPLCFSFL